MMKPHKHCELIKAWADGAVIERLWTDSLHPDRAWWLIDNEPTWDDYLEYRIKPEPKPDYHSFLALISKEHDIWRQYGYIANYSEFSQIVKLTHDGETHQLKSAEVLK